MKMIKNSIHDLAILGGNSAFEESLFVNRPNIGDREAMISRINDLLDRHWLTNNGRYVQEFEKRLAEITEAKHCIVMCNGTVALEIAIRALEIIGEVIIPSFTFIATAHALQWQKITPVFCDIDPNTFNIDPSRIEQLITPKTSAIIGVHLWGRPCEVEALKEISEKNKLRLLFDAAQAFGCSYKNRMIGTFGDAEVFSFHATKFFNTSEGGAVVTNNDKLADKIRLMKNFGFAGYDNVIYIGTNGKMSEISAAMGLTNLESIDDFIRANQTNYKEYLKCLKGLPGITMITYDETEKCNYQYISLVIDEDVAGISRDRIVEILHAENIMARRYFYPGCHQMEPYRSYFPHASLLLSETVRLSQQVLLLPTGTSISADDIVKICYIIRIIIENSTLLKKN